MDVLRDLPMGFGMALLQNREAARYFENCTPARQAAILDQVHTIQSKQDMKVFVDHLPGAAL